jgi:hypothetical protein
VLFQQGSDESPDEPGGRCVWRRHSSEPS